jgi:hypothetical protein
MERSVSESGPAPKKAKRTGFWTFSLLTSLISTLALVALVRRAIDIGSLAAPLNAMMAAYNATTQLAFGRAEPHLQALVASVDAHLNLPLTLHPYWKDALVLFGVYGAGYARAAFVSDEFKFGLGFVLRQIMLAVAVFFAAIVVGVLPLRSNDVLSQIAIFSLPVGMYSFGFAHWHDYVQTLLSAFYLVCVVAALTWLIGDTFGFVESLGFWSLALWVLGNGINLIFQGLASKEDRYAWVRAGLVIVGGFAGAACLFAIDAGLKLFAV